MISERDLVYSGREVALGHEGEKGTREIYLPSSPHFLQFYGGAFFEALCPEDPSLIQTMVTEYMQRVQSPQFSVHQTTDEPASEGEIRVSAAGAATIARDHLLELLNPDLTSDAKASRVTLVTSLDQLLASYFAKNVFMAMVLAGKEFAKDGRLETVKEGLTDLAEGKSFKIRAQKRVADVTILPMPADENFPKPRFFLIGPEESDFSSVLAQVKEKGGRVVFEAKRNQLELALAFLRKFESGRIIIMEGGIDDYQVVEGNRPRGYRNTLPPIEEGTFDFLIYQREGNVDGFIRGAFDNLQRAGLEIAGVFGIDVVQTGRALNRNNLKTIEEILPIPCYPVMIKVA